MRIALLTPDYYPALGGVETVVAHLARHFRQAGHDVLVVSGRRYSHLPEVEIVDDTTIVRVPQFVPFVTMQSDIAGRAKALAKGLASPFLLYPAYRRLRQRLREFAPDVVNVHYVGRNAIWARRLRADLNALLVTTVHGEDVRRDPWRSTIARRLVISTLQSSDMILSNSRYILDEAAKLVPDVRAKGLVVGNGIEPEEPVSVEPTGLKRPYVLMLGRLVREKGFDIGIEAFSTLAPECPTLTLAIVGDGTERRALQAQVRRRDLNNQVVFYGRADAQVRNRILAEAECLLVPSREEAFGIVALEAMRAGCPVVAAAVGGLPEIVQHEKTGLLVPPGDIRAMALAVLRILRNRGFAEQLTRAAREYVLANFTWDIVAQRYLRAFRAALAQRAGAT